VAPDRQWVGDLLLLLLSLVVVVVLLLNVGGGTWSGYINTSIDDQVVMYTMTIYTRIRRHLSAWGDYKRSGSHRRDRDQKARQRPEGVRHVVAFIAVCCCCT